MWGYIIPFVYIFSISGALALGTKKKFNEVLPLTIMGSALLMYTVGLVDFRIGYIICMALMISSMLYVLVFAIRNKKNNILFTSYGYESIVFVFLFAVIIVWNFSRMVVYGGDEYSHWAFMVKEMFRLDTFYVMPESNLGAHRDYPPLISLIQLLWCKAAGEFKEEYCYIALQVTSFAMLFPFLPQIKKGWQKWKCLAFIGLQAIILLVLCAVVQVAEAGFYKTLYTDCLVGVLFAYGVLFVILAKKIDFYFMLNISVFFAFLILSKQINLFIVIVVTCLVVYKYFEQRKNLTGILQSKIVSVVALCVCYVPSIILNFTWNMLVDKYDTYRQFEIADAGSIKDMLLAFIGHGTVTQKSVLLDYFVSILAEPIWERGAGFSFSQCLIGLVIGFAIVFYYSKERKKIFSIGIVIACSGAFYAVVMLATYLFMFSEREALKLACFDRYLLTYIYGSVIILVLCFINFADKITLVIRMGVALAVMILLIEPITIKEWLLPGFLYEGYSKKYEDDIAILQEYVGEEEKVYLISQGDIAGEARNILMYEVSPIQFQMYNFSLGNPKFEGDSRTVMLSVPELLGELEGYDYMYIYESDEDISRYYGELFENPDLINDEQLYKINRVNDEVQMILVNTMPE